MAAVRARQYHNKEQRFQIHHDEPEIEDSEPEAEDQHDTENSIEDEDEDENANDRDLNDHDSADSDTSEEGDIDPQVLEDMDKFQDTFRGIKHRFRLINRIGEGTFSTVYKAEDLRYDEYDNAWDLEERDKENNMRYNSPPLGKWQRAQSVTLGVDESRLRFSSSHTHHRSRRSRRPKYVAIKKIYVTSSPMRIYNELDLLNDLRGCPAVCPLITAFRHTDQVVAVLPYFRHTDFRDYFRNMTVPDMKIYFRSLFTALAAVHKQGILHRDIKPTNFLYDPDKQRGVLVDFGLAEREGSESKPCLCTASSNTRRVRISNSVAALSGPSNGYPKADPRPSRRANRAGTRGFRAPEVLLKCTDQRCAIDIWSAGVILLTIMSRRFPFFNSADDIEAMIEISTIFGTKRLKQTALLHGTLFETNIPTIGSIGFSLDKIILWSTCRNDGAKAGPNSSLSAEEQVALSFLEGCLELDPGKRLTAEDALHHPFLAESILDDEEDMDEVQML